MKKKEFVKIFKDEEIWNRAQKIDKQIRNVLVLLNKVLVTEIFDKLLVNFNNTSDIEIIELRNEFEEINELFYNRKISKGCRQTKGFIEDCYSFICQNYNKNSIKITSKSYPNDFRNYILENNKMLFSLLNDEIENDQFLSKTYNYVAKIDHHTSIRIMTKNLEQQTRIRNIQYSYCSITNFFIFLLFDFIYTKNKLKMDEDTLFVIETIATINTIIGISFVYNYDKKEYLNLLINSGLNNSIDNNYLDNLTRWNQNVLLKSKERISKDDSKYVKELFNDFNLQLKKRGYLD